MASSVFLNPSITEGTATQSIIPAVDNSYDLGSATYRWRSAYLGTSLIQGGAGALGTTSTMGAVLQNTTAAAAGAQQISYGFDLVGQGWKTNATAASQEVRWRQEVLPVQGAAAPTSTWKLKTSVNAGAFTEILTATAAAFTSTVPVIGADFVANVSKAYSAYTASALSSGWTATYGWLQGRAAAANVPILLNPNGGSVGIGVDVGDVFNTSLTLLDAFSIRWSDVQLSRLAAGSWASTGPNGSATNVQKATTSLTTNSGIGTATATNLIPAGSLVIGIDARITTVIAGAGMASFSIGDGSDADRWGTGIALAAGTTVTLADATINAAPIYAAATSVVLTANAGQFDSGVIRLTVHYLSLTAATS